MLLNSNAHRVQCFGLRTVLPRVPIKTMFAGLIPSQSLRDPDARQWGFAKKRKPDE